MKKKKQIDPAAEKILLAAAAAVAAEEEGKSLSTVTTTPTESVSGEDRSVTGAQETRGTDTEAPVAENTDAAPLDGKRTDPALLAAFLGALSEKERGALEAALAHLAAAERAREAEAALAAEEAAIAEMEKAPAFFGIGARREAIRALSSSVEWLGRLPLYERLAAAYYIDRGARYGEPTREQLLHAVLSDEALMRELALRRREAAASVAHTLPPVGKMRGVGSLPATVKKSPRSLDEATGEAKKFLRFYK